MMKIDLAGKIAIVTGSSGGIGYAIAEKLYEHGVITVLNGRLKEKLIEQAEQIQNKFSRPRKVETVEADLSFPEGVTRLIQAVPLCDILINNLGIYKPKPFNELSDRDWAESWETNVMSGVRLSRHYLQPMFQKKWGRILFISSESALQTPKEMIHYGVTKTAQVALAKGIAELTVETNITSNSVLVGPTLSEGVKEFVESIAKERSISKEEVEESFFREMRPDLSSAINGAALRCEGGVIKSIL